MGLPRLTRREAAFVIGVPIAWAVLLLFHPGGEGQSIYADLNGDGTRMLIVHVGTMVFIPLLALCFFLLLRGIDSTAARISRIGLVFFAVFYGAWEALQGIANGVLVDQVSSLSQDDQSLGASLIQDFAESPLVRDFGVFATIGTIALVVAAIAAGIALRDVGAPPWSPWLFGFAGFLISGHPPPYGPAGLVLFVIGVVLLQRGRSAETSPATVDAAPAAAQRRPFSPAERALLFGVPIAWGLLLLLHPTGEGEDFYPIVRDQVTTWQVVHIGTLLFVPLMAAVLLLLLRGLAGRAATVSRVAVLFFAVFYTVWEVLIGIGNGALINEVNGLGDAQRPVGAEIVELYTDSGLLRTLELIGTGAWIVALIAAGIALVREAGAPLTVPALLFVAALPIAWHVAPFGQIGLLLFIGAVALVVRSDATGVRSAGTGQPAPA